MQVHVINTLTDAHGMVEVKLFNSDLCSIQIQKGSKERLVIMTRTHNMQIIGEILFVKPQNYT